MLGSLANSPDNWGMDKDKAQLWQSVRKLAEDINENPQAIYAALYDKPNPMQCARKGRAIRVRLCDWLAYWNARTQTVIVREPARAAKRVSK